MSSKAPSLGSSGGAGSDTGGSRGQGDLLGGRAAAAAGGEEGAEFRLHLSDVRAAGNSNGTELPKAKGPTRTHAFQREVPAE